MRGQMVMHLAAPDGGCGMGRREANWLGFGLIESPIGTFRDNGVAPFLLLGNRQGAFLSLAPAGPDVSREIWCNEMGSVTTSAIWPRPMNGDAGGGLLTRLTRMPARPGMEMRLATMVLSGGHDAFLDRHMYAMDFAFDHVGRIIQLRDPKRCEPAEINGVGFNAMHGLPIWGWGQESVGFRSSLPLELIDRCERYRLLQDRDRTPEEETEFKGVDHEHTGWVFHAGRDDATYQKFRREMARRGAVLPMDGVHSAAQLEDQDRIAGEVLRLVLQEEGDRWAA